MRTDTWHDLIQALRAKGASAETVRQILRARNVQVSETTVRNYLREVQTSGPRRQDGCPQGHSPIAVLVFLACLVLARPTHAGGRVTDCDPASLEGALAGGGLVTFECSGAIGLTRTIRVTSDTVVDGSGQGVTLDGLNQVRIFEVPRGVHLTLANLTLARGFHLGGPDGIAGAGGGVLVEGGALTVTNCVFRGNRARGTDASAVPTSTLVSGGAIRVEAGTLELHESRFEGNQSETAAEAGFAMGGAISLGQGTLRARRTRFDANMASATAGAQGGAIHATGSRLLLEECSFDSNAVGIHRLPWAAGGAGPVGGGAIWIEGGDVEPAVVLASRFDGNRAESGSGTNLASEGLGGAIYSGGALVCARSTFVSNRVVGALSLQRRYPGRGGAVWSRGTLTISDCTFDANEAAGHEGLYPTKFWSAVSGSDGLGGGLHLEGSATVTASVFSRNLATGGAGSRVAGFQPSNAGIGWGGAVFAAGAVAMVNCTLIGNTAAGGDAWVRFPIPSTGYGGAIHANAGTFMGTNLTLVGNTTRGGSVGYPNTPEGEIHPAKGARWTWPPAPMPLS